MASIQKGQRACAGALILSLAVGGSGCGGSSSGPGDSIALKLNIELETPALASQVEVVTLTVRYGDVPDPDGPDTLNFIDGVIHDTVSVAPGDSVRFTLHALDANSRVLYRGDTTVATVPPGGTLVLSILLRPAVLMFRAGPLLQVVEFPRQDLVDIQIDVYNVDSLFGASFRIHYDPTVLDFVSATEGEFLKVSGNPGATWSGVLADSADVVAYFVTRLRQSTGVPIGSSTGTTPGRLATFHFSRVGVGSSDIVIDPEYADLREPDGDFVRNFSNIVLESATVQVVSGL